MKRSDFLIFILFFVTNSVASQIILTNDETWAWANSWALFPKKNEVDRFKTLIENNHEVVEVFFFEDRLSLENVDVMGGGGDVYLYECIKKNRTCKLVKKSLMR
ncbi:hypothetical protein [Rahnella sikkimica]|uniref:Uncharacterized protein n=1 Tax=Rahnella sikkimica TaxID=1805933 RepID=A0A2L1UP71_9GAMM|nr:hypothetical protein [Rahnella sikkimica]AVF34734.1 hypothetical protein BV494_07215 [Rahnella sikkimica]